MYKRIANIGRIKCQVAFYQFHERWKDEKSQNIHQYNSHLKTVSFNNAILNGIQHLNLSFHHKIQTPEL